MGGGTGDRQAGCNEASYLKDYIEAIMNATFGKLGLVAPK
jgi:hypothetical protein